MNQKIEIIKSAITNYLKLGFENPVISINPKDYHKEIDEIGFLTHKSYFIERGNFVISDGKSKDKL